MNDFIQLLITYWKPIVGLLFTIAGFIIALIKKKPISDILTDIYYASVKAVNDVEERGLVGSDNKLFAAINIVYAELGKKYPTLNAYAYEKLIVKIIEDILSTPHKKG